MSKTKRSNKDIEFDERYRDIYGKSPVEDDIEEMDYEYMQELRKRYKRVRRSLDWDE